MTNAWLIEAPVLPPLYVGVGGSACIAPWVGDASRATKFATEAEATERLKALQAVDSKGRFTNSVVREHGFYEAEPNNIGEALGPSGAPVADIQAAIAHLVKGAVGVGIPPEQLANINAEVTVDVLKEQFPLVSHLLEDAQAKFAAGFLTRINKLLSQ